MEKGGKKKSKETRISTELKKQSEGKKTAILQNPAEPNRKSDAKKQPRDSKLKDEAVKVKPILKNRIETVGDVKSTGSFNTNISEMTWYSPAEEGNTEKPTEKRELTRTECLLFEHKKFLAARKIQTLVRGWLVRNRMRKRVNAAVLIQYEWRKFYKKRMKFRKLEEDLQQRIWKFYNDKATLIQALWRGFWVRQNIHDHYRLQRMQEQAAKELLYCVAFKLHYLLRTYHIPGIYSIRNSRCLSKIEQLLASLNFKELNAKCRRANANYMGTIADGKAEFERSKFGTKLPYPGNSASHLPCQAKCYALYSEKDADARMHKIMSIYQASKDIDPRVLKMQQRKKLNGPKKKSKKRAKPKPTFCSDIIDSMMKWKILNDKNLTLNRNIFDNPENVEKFISDINATVSFMDLRCHCSNKLADMLEHQSHCKK